MSQVFRVAIAMFTSAFVQAFVIHTVLVSAFRRDGMITRCVRFEHMLALSGGIKHGALALCQAKIMPCQFG